MDPSVMPAETHPFEEGDNPVEFLIGVLSKLWLATEEDVVQAAVTAIGLNYLRAGFGVDEATDLAMRDAQDCCAQLEPQRDAPHRARPEPGHRVTECPLVTLDRIWTYPPTASHLVMAKHQLREHGWCFRANPPAQDVRVLLVAAISGHDVRPHPHHTLS